MRNYYSDEDYVNAEYVIYNDLNEDLLPGVSQVDLSIDEDKVNKLLEKGEKWVDLSSHQRDGYIVTSYGRIINVGTIKGLKPTITNVSIHFYLFQKKFDIQAVFKENNWRYNIEEIEEHYKRYGWRYSPVKAAIRKSIS